MVIASVFSIGTGAYLTKSGITSDHAPLMVTSGRNPSGRDGIGDHRRIDQTGKRTKKAVFLKNGTAIVSNIKDALNAAKTRMWQDVVPVSFQWDVLASARRYHIPVPILAAVLHVETGHQVNPATAVSSAGAIGPMQLMPDTAWNQLRINPWRPAENIRGGARYLAMLIREFHGLKTALMAYNAGPTAVFNHAVPEQAVYYANNVLNQSRMLSAR